MFKKNIYVIETARTQAFVAFLLFVIIFGIFVIKDGITPRLVLRFVLFSIADLLAARNSIIFCNKRDKALDQPVYAEGEIIGIKNVHYPMRSPRTVLYVKLDNGDTIATTEMWKRNAKKIVSERVNMYRYDDFLYVGDVQIQNGRDEIPIDFEKMNFHEKKDYIPK
jgi:hypothetical protein